MKRSSFTMRAFQLVALCGLGLVLLASSALAGQARKGKKKQGPKPAEVKKIEAAMPTKPAAKPAKPRTILVLNLCQGFRHGCIPYWDKALQIMAEKTGAFSVTITSDLNALRRDNLHAYDALCLNNTTKLKLDPKKTPELCESVMSFIKGGKGVIGIHAATDNFYGWPEAREMMGGTFTGHPWTSGGTWAIKIDRADHPLMKPFAGKGFKIRDEIYRTDPPLYSREKQLVLMSLDMNDPKTRNVKGFKPADADTGISWVRNWGKGRVFYCSLGHNNDVTWNEPVLQHYLLGIQFALGDLKIDTKP